MVKIKSVKLLPLIFFAGICIIFDSHARAEGDSDLTGIYIKCVPPGADVYLDNVKAGQASPEFKSMDLVPDQLITVTLKMKDYNPLTFKVQVHKGLNKFEYLKLKPAFGYLTLTGAPEDAKISVDGKVIGHLGEIRQFKLKSGRHSLDAERDGMKPVVDRLIKIFDAEHSQENIELENITKITVLKKAGSKAVQQEQPPGPEIPLSKASVLTKRTPDIFKKNRFKSNSPAGKDVPAIKDNHLVVISIHGGSGSLLNKPESIKIRAGESVVWKNMDTRFHYIVYKPEFSLYASYGKVDDGDDEEEEEEDTQKSLFNSPKLDTGDSWSFQFQKPGTYSYYCFIHPLEITGTVIVE